MRRRWRACATSCQQSLAVVIEEVSPREGRDDLIDVHAILFVGRDSQKGIVIGKGGARLREVGTVAHTQIEQPMGTKVYCDLQVKIAKNWQNDPKQLGSLGFQPGTPAPG